MAGWKNKRTVMHRYDLTADMYNERYEEEQQAKYKAALGKVNLAGKCILDVGCGTGLFFSHAEACASMVAGVDTSRKLLLKAKDKAEKMSNVFVLRADADYLPFNQSFFDVVFLFTVLQNMPEPSETLEELKRITKLSGNIVVTGLKRAFPLSTFLDFLENTSMPVASLIDEEDLKCYVAVLAVK